MDRIETTPKKCEGCQLAKSLVTAIQLNRQMKEMLESEVIAFRRERMLHAKKMYDRLLDLSRSAN